MFTTRQAHTDKENSCRGSSRQAGNAVKKMGWGNVLTLQEECLMIGLFGMQQTGKRARHMLQHTHMENHGGGGGKYRIRHRIE